MNREDYLVVALRLFAVWLLLTALWFGMGTLVRELQAGGFPLATVASMVPMAGIAVLLWFFPLTVARKLLPVMREPQAPLQAPAREVEAVAFTVLGLWILANALVDAAYWLLLAWMTRRSEFENLEWTSDQIASVLATAIEIALAIGLLLGTRGLQLALQRLRGR